MAPVFTPMQEHAQPIIDVLTCRHCRGRRGSRQLLGLGLSLAPSTLWLVLRLLLVLIHCRLLLLVLRRLLLALLPVHRLLLALLPVHHLLLRARRGLLLLLGKVRGSQLLG
jgi:hypothetical protein